MKPFFAFFWGVFVGSLFSFFTHKSTTVDAPKPSPPTCPVPELRYERKRAPFRGPLPQDWLSQWSGVPVTMRYEFTLNGTVGVDNNPPTQEGAPAVDTGEVWRGSTSHAGGGQVYARLLDADKSELLLWKVGNRMLWRAELVSFLIDEVALGRDISCPDYPRSAPDVMHALNLVGVRGKRLMVGGSVTPWVEAIALHLGAAQVVTTDYSVPVCRDCHPRLSTLEMTHALKRSTPASYDIIVSYSSIEHDGLGRYGDPLDPEGDFHAMREFRTLLRPGGFLLLAVPCWKKDAVIQLLARVYADLRLPLLLRGWDYRGGTVNHGAWSPNLPLSVNNEWGWQPIMILRNTDSNCSITCADASLYGHACRPSLDCGILHRPNASQ